MKISLYILSITLMSDVFSVSNDKNDSDADTIRRRIIKQLTRTRTVLLDGYHLATRQVVTDVYKYRSYRTVSIVMFPMMRDVEDAKFTFLAEAIQLNAIGSCEASEIIIHLKLGSYPAVNPDGYSFPKDFIDPHLRDPIHTLDLKSDGSNITYSMKNPWPGNWYALVYIKWEDPRTQAVTQQGLVAECQTILYSDLQIKKSVNITLIDCDSELTIDYENIPADFKCIYFDVFNTVQIVITINNIPSNARNVLFKLNANRLPTNENHIISCSYDPLQSSVQTITFFPKPNTWHYISLTHISNNATIAECESYEARTDADDVSNITVLDLMRDEKGKFFTFDYGIPTTQLLDVTSLINLTSSEIKALRFEVNSFLDIGGTLTLEVSLLMAMKYYMGYIRRPNKDKLLEFSESDQFYKVVICANIGYVSLPLATGLCRYNDVVKPALFVLNSTDSETIYKKSLIPFPESGTWYLSSRLFCDNSVCPCSTSDNGAKYYVNPNKNRLDVLANNSDVLIGVKNCNARVLLSIGSASCVDGKCSNHGSCLLNTFGGLVMSFCSCLPGYGGWDCSDSTRMDSFLYMLTSVLLLSLSNLAFIFSVYCAVIRRYHTEAIMYAFSMVLSTFYHACDASAQVAYCIVKSNILQFGDFYCGIMSFWVTLLAMSVISSKLRSSMQLIGAIMIALLTTWNMHSIVTFLTPVAVGATAVSVTWFIDYTKRRTMVYPRSYYTRYFPLGLLLVSVGLICYAFLQTENNYRIVHSIWHILIAVSVAFLLPDVKRGANTNPFYPSSNYCKIYFCKLFKRPEAAVANN